MRDRCGSSREIGLGGWGGGIPRVRTEQSNDLTSNPACKGPDFI